MLDFSNEASRYEKCYTTLGQLPVYIDPKQPPSKKTPFSTIAHHPFIHTVELIFPQEFAAAWESVQTRLRQLQYIRAILPLSALLENDFFNTFIKAGNLLMLSEGRPGVDNVFSLHNGILRLELGKEPYERSGLQGKPIRSGGRKHAKERFVVELNLRLPSMLHGKKGFERIVWAFKNVLNNPVSWLVCDPASDPATLDQVRKTLAPHAPQLVDCVPNSVAHPPTVVPPLSVVDITVLPSEAEIRDYCDELAEWMGLVSLGSPRVRVGDGIDPYLSRYEVPQLDNSQPTSSRLVSVKWHGMIPSPWITHLLLQLLLDRASRDLRPAVWFALTCTAFKRDAVENKDGYTVLCVPRGNSPPTSSSDGVHRTTDVRDYICWEYIGAVVSQ
ncbi:hypothetical protein VTN49DRAFT_7471 [Thermomyces lanuginosus]|uniref:uncharacterized protein n=1 Tax=Thermomyces lanuginosus TaxID=5541 RepID=UPI003743EB9D